MTILKTLKWNNCFSYGEGNELQLDQAKVTQIVGLNGHGKSSIPLILEEALYNKNSKGVKKASIPNRYINSGYTIYVSWETDGKEYEVFVDRKSGIKVRLLEDGEDISSHTATNTYKTIESIIGVDFKIFSQLVYQNTNTSLQFLTATDANRKKFLIDLLHLDEYMRLFEVFKSVAKEVTSEVSEFQAKIDTIEKWLSNNKLGDTTILPMEKLEIDTEDDEKEYRELSTEIENISEKNKKILKNNQYKAMLAKIDLNKAKEIKVTKKESYDDLQSDLGKAQAAVVRAEKEIKKLSLLGDTCPTCEQKVDENFIANLVAAEGRVAANNRKLVETYNEQIAKIKENNQLFELKQRLERDWEELYRSIDQGLPDNVLDEGQLKERLGRVRAKLLRAKEQLAETARLNEERTRRNTRIQVIQEQTDEFIEELNKHQELLNERKTLLSDLEILKKAFSTNGLLAYKIENLVKELEEITNHYLGELSGGQFTLEFVVVNDKLTVKITDSGLDVDINELSSGELAKVNTSTLLAIHRLMSSISKSRINTLFLDEIINVLDMHGREKLTEILLEEEGLNTFLVSHGWTHPLLEKIEVVKEDNISRIEV